MWYKKKVKTYGSMGQIALPKPLVGKDIWVITDDEARELKELVEVTLIHRKAYQKEQNELKDQMDNIFTELKAKIARLEKVVYG